MLVGGNNGVNNQYLNVLFYPLGSVATPNPMPTCLNGAKDEIDGTEREFTALFPNAGTEKCTDMSKESKDRLRDPVL